MSDLAAIGRSLKDAVAFARQTITQVRTLSRQTNTVLYGIFGTTVGAFLGTAAVVAGGSIFLPFIPIALLMGGTAGVLFGRKTSETIDEDDGYRVDRLHERRSAEIATINEQIKLQPARHDDLSRLIDDLLAADAKTLQLRYFTAPRPELGNAASPILLSYHAKAAKTPDQS